MTSVVAAVVVVEAGLLGRVLRGGDFLVIVDQLLVEDVLGCPIIKLKYFPDSIRP